MPRPPRNRWFRARSNRAPQWDLSALFFFRALTRPSIGDWAGYVIFGALGVYAQPFGILVLPAEWLSLWLFRPGRETVIRLTASAIIFGLLALPALALALAHGSGMNDWMPGAS